MVDIGSGVSGNPQAAAVADMFNTYFSGINQHHYKHAMTVFAHDNVVKINPNNPASVSTFAYGDRTSNDSEIVLTNLQSASNGELTAAEVTFQSQQAAGLGPGDDPSETCTLWDITYELAQSSSGQYLIYKITADTNSGC
jgi:eukaryotic-like serine/threonine-protein kinase